MFTKTLSPHAITISNNPTQTFRIIPITLRGIRMEHKGHTCVYGYTRHVRKLSRNVIHNRWEGGMVSKLSTKVCSLFDNGVDICMLGLKYYQIAGLPNLKTQPYEKGSSRVALLPPSCPPGSVLSTLLKCHAVGYSRVSWSSTLEWRLCNLSRHVGYLHKHCRILGKQEMG